MPIPSLTLKHIDPQPSYHHSGTVSPDSIPFTHVRLGEHFRNGERITSKDYICLTLEVENSHSQRLLYVPYSAALQQKLDTSDSPLHDVLSFINQNEEVVIIGKWMHKEKGPSEFFHVKTADLLLVYPVAERP